MPIRWANGLDFSSDEFRAIRRNFSIKICTSYIIGKKQNVLVDSARFNEKLTARAHVEFELEFVYILHVYT